MPFYTWSTTAASNATADPTCPFPEGMAPSAVNDGVRAAMARLREFGDDIAGAIVAGGTATAYTVASNQGFTSLAAMNGQAIAFTPNVTCGATVTLNVDGLGAQPLRSAPGVELLAGTLIQGTPYVAVYNATAGAFYLHSFFANPYNIPVGGMMPYLSTTAPNSSFVLPYGQAISRTAYATLFAMTGTAFGSGDGATTFNVPDLRGRIPVGLDNMGGTASGRVTAGGSGLIGTTLGATGGTETVTLTVAQMPSHQHGVYLKDPTHNHSQQGSPYGGYGSGGNPALDTGVGSSTAYAPTGITIGSVSGVANDNQTATVGGGSPANNVQPSIVIPWILRVI